MLIVPGVRTGPAQGMHEITTPGVILMGMADEDAGGLGHGGILHWRSRYGFPTEGSGASPFYASRLPVSMHEVASGHLLDDRIARVQGSDRRLLASDGRLAATEDILLDLAG